LEISIERKDKEIIRLEALNSENEGRITELIEKVESLSEDMRTHKLIKDQVEESFY